eukprot:359869-Chlamydomonas_euryale.AAC.16
MGHAAAGSQQTSWRRLRCRSTHGRACRVRQTGSTPCQGGGRVGKRSAHVPEGGKGGKKVDKCLPGGRGISNTATANAKIESMCLGFIRAGGPAGAELQSKGGSTEAVRQDCAALNAGTALTRWR